MACSRKKTSASSDAVDGEGPAKRISPRGGGGGREKRGTSFVEIPSLPRPPSIRGASFAELPSLDPSLGICLFGVDRVRGRA